MPLPPIVPPRPIVRAAFALRRRLQQLADAVVPAELVLAEEAMGVTRTMMLRVAVRLRIADILSSGPRTAAELAQEAGVDASALHRTLRALVSLGVFALDASTGRFSNNRLSEGLRTGKRGDMRDFIEYFSSHSNLRAWLDIEETVRTGKNAFERVFGMSVWDWFAKHPEEERVFAETMVALTSIDAPVLASTYPFGELRSVCDVAGGRGTLLAAILRAHPQLRGVLVDAPGVAATAREFLSQQQVLDRTEIRSGNIFTDVPAGCDAYILKDILHDWDDARSEQILKNVRRAMQPGNRLLICEVIVEPMDTDVPGPLIDVHMLTVCSDGRQRSRAEFAELLGKCGFELRRVFEMPLPISIVEGVAR